MTSASSVTASGSSPVTSRTFTYSELPYPPVVAPMLAALAAGFGEHELMVASRGDGDDERITYAQAERESALMARRLLTAGVGKGTRIGILAPNGTEFLVAFLAITRIGAVAVPINTFFQAQELAWLLDDADIHTVVSVGTLLGKDMLDRLRDAAGGDLRQSDAGPIAITGLPFLRHVLPLGPIDREWPSRWPEPAPEALLRAAESRVRPSDDLVVIYTSGSTSAPKGIIHTHSSVITHSHFIAAAHGWSSDDRVYVPMAFFWVGGLVFGVLGPLQLGVTILTEHRFEPGDVLRLLAAEKATYTTGFPHVGPALVNHPDFAHTDLSSLRDGYQQVLLPPERRAPDPTLRVAQLGMTETCSSHTWWPPSEPVPESKRGSLGVSAPGFEHKVVDEHGAVVPDHQVGEICVRGAAMMRGVVGRKLSDLLDADGWYHTSDAGYRDADGHLFFSGRIDDMVKTSGANVAPVEVEAVLNDIDGIRIAYVIGLPDAAKGALVAAVVVFDEGRHHTEADLVTACRARLAAYKVPKRWVLLPGVEGLPYTTTNKIDKRRLVAMVSSGAVP
ncbi:acyl--CoA ligase [Mycolicibacterium sp. 018/SC-01/001]|uniref:class I adenylate-forming enzyme family protein n=1 Tax=Mycolicibacterium sp. 018/SC-01/001 TaxID=2592069 RepID=UPI0011811EC7|nr:class I adenylate-forming enzyme family protein [Mycolicibacterium sp. 018/SC-01/001]TRW79637.1 acyl--CoA ligase [Mycolicibacterium sp. 018/SC-01/001]